MVPAVEDFTQKKEMIQRSVSAASASVSSVDEDDDLVFRGERLLTPDQLRDQLKVCHFDGSSLIQAAQCTGCIPMRSDWGQVISRTQAFGIAGIVAVSASVSSVDEVDNLVLRREHLLTPDQLRDQLFGVRQLSACSLP
jgi:hypothetical protein